MSASCEPRRATSLRSASRSAWMSPLAADAARLLSRAASLASFMVSRTVSRIVLDVLDMQLLRSDREIFAVAPTGRKRKSSTGAIGSAGKLLLVGGEKVMQGHQTDDQEGNGEKRSDRTPHPGPKRQRQQDRERIEREAVTGDCGGYELAFQRGKPHERGRRDQRVTQGRECHESDGEQDQRHATGADVWHVVEHHRHDSEDDGTRKAEQPGADGDHDAEAEVDG